MGKTVGVIGGMGPEATVDFMSKVLAATPASKDQDHIRMLVDNNPGVPCRQEALRGDGQDPGPVLASMAAGLERAGADFLVMPCNTAHVWADAIAAAVNIPFVSIITETVAACTDFDTVGLLGTTGCIDSNVYQAGLEGAGKRFVTPGTDEQAEIMDLVFRVKAGERGAELEGRMTDVANALVGRGAQAVVAGCTEIPLILPASGAQVPVVDSTEVLARATITRCAA